MDRLTLGRLIGVGLLAAACGGAGNVTVPTPSPLDGAPEGAAMPSPTRATLPPVTPPPAPAGSGTPVVNVGDHFIEPPVLVVKVGTTVTWRYNSGSHDITARDGSFKSPLLSGDFSVTFTKPGRYPYFCSFHAAEMKGEIIVEPN